MAYVSKEEAKTARAIANKMGKKYGFKLSTTKCDGELNIALMSGKQITMEDIKCDSIMKSFIDKYGFSIDNEDDFIEKYSEFLNADRYIIIEHYWKYLHIKEIIQDARGVSASVLKDDCIIVKMFNQIEASIKKALKWFDDSDSMTDYFYTAFYYNTEIGKWNKKYIGGVKC